MHFSNIFRILLNTYGIGFKTIRYLFFIIGVNVLNRPMHLKKHHERKLFKNLKHKKFGINLRIFVRERILFFFNIQTRKGIRHKKSLPIRGQRTHTNNKTKKKL